MDFTFLFLVILMLFAWQNNMQVVSAALLVVAVVSAAKNSNKLLLLAALVAAALLVFLFVGLGDATGTIVIGGLFAIFIIIILTDSGAPPSPYGGYA